MPAAGGRGGLLAAIQGGKRLKKVSDKPRPRPSGGGSGGGGGGAVSLFDQIKQGKKLKKARRSTVKPERKAPRMDLFSQIRAGGSKLKKVDHEKIKKERAESRPASGGGGIMGALQMAINKNRKKIAMSDSDGGDSDWSDSD
jgi:hypothetical protein